MKALLDTHTFLWWITDDQRLSAIVRDIISDGENNIYLSAASGWEIAIKAKIGKLSLPDDLIPFIAEQLTVNAISSLPIQMSHTLHTYSLPPYHRDPFDRLLVAQSILESLPLLTSDSQISKYPVQVVW